MTNGALKAAHRLRAMEYIHVSDGGGLGYEFASDVDRVATAYIAEHAAHQRLLKELHELSRDIKVLNVAAEKL